MSVLRLSIVHQALFKQISNFNLCLKTVRLYKGLLRNRSGRLFQRAGPDSGEASWPNTFLFLFIGTRRLTSRRRAKTRKGWNSWFLHKHLREVSRSGALETLVNWLMTQLEIDSWTVIGHSFSGIIWSRYVSRDWIELSFTEDSIVRALPLTAQSAVDRLNHFRFQPAGCYSSQETAGNKCMYKSCTCIIRISERRTDSC